MRVLMQDELRHVSGGSGCYDPCDCDSGGKHKHKHKHKKSKGNNGFGNGGNDGVPGRSGKQDRTR